MARKWMGDEIENAIKRTGADRNAIIRYIWECKCRNRHKHYHKIAEWASGSIGNESTIAIANLEMILAEFEPKAS